MIPAAVLTFFLGGLVVTFLIHVSDRRAVQREAEFWEQLKGQALDGYGRVFDWAEECKEFGCQEDTP